MPLTSRPPSMADVAARAGVSYQTVSRVLNEPHRVRTATREKVLAAISALGYTRNRAARALRTTRSSLLGVLTDGSSLFGPAETTTAIETAARQAGYSVLLTTVGPDGTDDQDVGAQLLGSGVDGVLVVAAHEAMLSAVEHMARSTPVLSVSAQPAQVPGVEVVGVDQQGGARLVMEHLADRGARSVVHVTGPQNWFDAKARREGFEVVLDELDIDGALTSPGDWSPGSGYRAGSQLVEDALPDAIFAANDMMALGLIRALSEHGVRIPEDVLVVGFDDIASAEYLCPPLTTVAQPFGDLGRRALQELLRTLEGPGGGATEELEDAAAKRPGGAATEGSGGAAGPAADTTLIDAETGLGHHRRSPGADPGPERRQGPRGTDPGPGHHQGTRGKDPDSPDHPESSGASGLSRTDPQATADSLGEGPTAEASPRMLPPRLVARHSTSTDS